MMDSRVTSIPTFEFSAILVLAIAAPGLGACSNTPAPVTAPADPVAWAQTAPTRSVAVVDDGPSASESDARITAAVSGRLEADPDPDLQAVAVSTSSGIVTLTGNVSTPGARNVAVFIADDISGVVSVVNELVIETDYDG